VSDKTTLAEKLGTDTVAELTEAECTELAEMIRTVRRSRFKAMMASIDEALGHLPRPLRIPAKKILGV
jgi:hypothetical protein